jgi:hypothetical protein
MKSITLTLLAVFMLFAGSGFAQSAEVKPVSVQEATRLDLSGKWMGKRHQYTWDKKGILQTFEYEFELKQEGNLVTGVSTIINENGEYADMKLQGVIVGNKFIFEEYEVQSAVRPDGRVWCFKRGELSIVKRGESIALMGATASYMETYNYPCSGGFTDIVKADNSNNETAGNQRFDAINTDLDAGNLINIFPNPFIEKAVVNYTIAKDSKVSVEIFDMQGKQIAVLQEGTQKAGTYNLDFNAKSFGFFSGVYIVKMTVNGEIFSRQLVQMR